MDAETINISNLVYRTKEGTGFVWQMTMKTEETTKKKKQHRYDVFKAEK